MPVDAVCFQLQELLRARTRYFLDNTIKTSRTLKKEVLLLNVPTAVESFLGYMDAVRTFSEEADLTAKLPPNFFTVELIETPIVDFPPEDCEVSGTFHAHFCLKSELEGHGIEKSELENDTLVGTKDYILYMFYGAGTISHVF